LLRPDFGLYNENLLYNPSFIINQDVYDFTSTVAPGNYYLDHWFNDAGAGASNTITRSAIGTPSVDEEYYFSTAGASQVFWPMQTHATTTIPIDLIRPGDQLTISAKISSGGSLTVYTGYGSPNGSGTALTTSLAGTLTSSTDSITFSADFGGWPVDQTPLAVTIAGTYFKDVKIERGGIRTDFVPRDFYDELRIAEIHYRKTYPYEKPPGDTTSGGYILYTNNSGAAAYWTEGFTAWRFESRMRLRRFATYSPPKFTVYAPFSGTKNRASWWNGTSWADSDYDDDAYYASETGISELEICLTAGLPDTRPMAWHMVVDARY
jgi:hypothetical protein